MEGFATPLASSSSACLQAAALILIRFFHERPDYELRSRVPASLKQDERWANTGYPLSPTGDLKINALDIRAGLVSGNGPTTLREVPPGQRRSSHRVLWESYDV